MGSLRHGALPQAGAKTAPKTVRMSAAPQKKVTKKDANALESLKYLNLNDLTNSRLNAMSKANQLKAVDNDTLLNSSTLNKKEIVSKNNLLYPKESIVNENFTVTNKKFPEMNENAQSVLTGPDFIGPKVDNTVKKTSKVRGLNSFDFLGLDYMTGKKNTAKGDSKVTVNKNPVTGSTIGDLGNRQIKDAYNVFDLERQNILKGNTDSQPER